MTDGGDGALPTSLLPHQVFVFGSNRQGFHGAGAAGHAFRGTAANTWRNDAAFLEAMRSPVGSPLRVGKWAVFGVSSGYQRGREGQSYAVVTVARPGQKRSVPLSDIHFALSRLVSFAKHNQNLELLVSPIGTGHAGYTAAEMQALWDSLAPIPGNVRFLFGRVGP